MSAPFLCSLYRKFLEEVVPTSSVPMPRHGSSWAFVPDLPVKLCLSRSPVPPHGQIQCQFSVHIHLSGPILSICCSWSSSFLPLKHFLLWPPGHLSPTMLATPLSLCLLLCSFTSAPWGLQGSALSPLFSLHVSKGSHLDDQLLKKKSAFCWFPNLYF